MLIELVSDESKLVTSVIDDTLLTLVDVHELNPVRQDSKFRKGAKSSVWRMREDPDLGFQA